MISWRSLMELLKEKGKEGVRSASACAGAKGWKTDAAAAVKAGAEGGCGIMALIDGAGKGRGRREKGRKKVLGAHLHAQEPGNGGQVLLLQHGGRVASNGAALCQLHRCRDHPAAADAAQRTHAVQCVVAARHHAPQIACASGASTLTVFWVASPIGTVQCERLLQVPGMWGMVLLGNEHPSSYSILQT